MRHFLIKTTLFLLPILLGVVFCEIAHRNADNDYKYKYKWLSQYSNRVQILSFGSSHGYFGIDPTQFDYKAFNMGQVSQDLCYDEFIFDVFVDRMDSLLFVILPISYSTPWDRQEDGIESWRAKYYCIYYHCPYHRWEMQYNLEIATGIRPFVAVQEVLGKSNRHCTELGHCIKDKFVNSYAEWKELGYTAAKRHSHDMLDVDIYQKNQTYARKIIEKCKNKGVGVLLVTTPAFITYRECLNDEQLSLQEAFCRTLQNEYDNVYYLNMLSDPRFDEDDFYDADHLNGFGAAKFSSILNQFIKSSML